MKKKFLVLLTLLLAFSMVLAACAPQEATPEPVVEEPVEEPAEEEGLQLPGSSEEALNPGCLGTAEEALEAPGDPVNYLKGPETIDLFPYQEEPIDIEMPITVELVVTQTDPGFRGDTATGGNKPATLETGVVVNVPLFINEGDTLKIDTRTGDYLERVS